MKRLIASSLTVSLLLISGLQEARAGNEAAETPRSQLASVPAGSLIEVRMNNKTKIRGRKGDVSPDSFVLKSVSGKGSEIAIAFADVQSLTIVKSHTTRNILIGVGITVGIVVVVAVWVVRHLQQ